MSTMINNICYYKSRTFSIIKFVVDTLNESIDRQILVLSDRKKQLEDIFNIVTEKGLKGGYTVLKKIVEVIQNKIIPNSTVICEPMMNKRKLRPSLSTGKIHQDKKNILDFMNYCDGKNDLTKIANLINLPKNKVKKLFRFLLEKKLITDL